MSDDWRRGDCDRCECEALITEIDPTDHDKVCLVCLDLLEERGEIVPATGRIHEPVPGDSE